MSKVMIVDDSLFMLEHISKLLRKRGYDAVRLYEENSPDVVLMDVTMPGRDGLEALSEIRQIDANAKVVMLTALNQEWLVTQAMNMGAKDFLTKPVSPDRLISTLERVISYA